MLFFSTYCSHISKSLRIHLHVRPALTDMGQSMMGIVSLNIEHNLKIAEREVRTETELKLVITREDISAADGAYG